MLPNPLFIPTAFFNQISASVVIMNKADIFRTKSRYDASVDINSISVDLVSLGGNVGKYFE